MGNESSSVALSQFKVDESPILSAHGWSLHHAQKDDEALTVFVDTLSSSSDSLLRVLETNLKLFRHPNILKFVTSCSTSGTLYLFTEKVYPLGAVLNQQTPMQVVLGLYDVLTALEFLHNRAKLCHNNLNLHSIFVTTSGRWKLAGMEFAKSIHEMNNSFLQKNRAQRNESSVPPEENTPDALKNSLARDVFGFGVLAKEVLSSHVQSEFDTLMSFSMFILERMLNPNPDLRPSLKEIQSHAVFQCKFIEIIEFLRHLPLKSKSEKEAFFSDLLPKLFEVQDEQLIGQHMFPLLLSRVVLLDATAVKRVIPSLLTPYEAHSSGDPRGFQPNETLNPVLSLQAFKDHAVPMVRKIFHVRDYSVRTVLLDHFSSYCHTVPTVILEEEILPLLLIGMKDINDEMVASTLRALAELVPILGAQVVVGKKQRKVFSDGKPHQAPNGMRRKSFKSSSVNTDIVVNTRRENGSSSPESGLTLPSHRHSPIGAEESEPETDPSKTEEILFSEDIWDDWGEEAVLKEEVLPSSPIKRDDSPLQMEEINPVHLARSISGPIQAIVPITDITEIDIKVSKPKKGSPEVDFFADMEPEIKLRGKSLLELEAENAKENSVRSKFEVEADSDGWDEDGWGNDEIIAL
ncbi:hypothetical protein TCAL_00432 [Tigriopus californicus]|uniref:Protein kinase domain-containing protein n=1 Tax=Tigriopus californicus TaxID=6832 RepID=A0A553NDX3_TIGCA|nr:protein-associating with the carboxyl-terminal domain of ezrin-like [Tigriopus californicus]TRY63608.1 hypothetical protein TCAL_00432 [Tigriopus californicus]